MYAVLLRPWPLFPLLLTPFQARQLSLRVA